MKNDNDDLAKIVRCAITDALLKDKEICARMGLDAANGSKKIKSGALITKTVDLFRLWEITKSPSLQAFIAKKIGLVLSENSLEKEREFERLKSQNSKYLAIIKILLDEN
jgi:hypothetical protein